MQLAAPVCTVRVPWPKPCNIVVGPGPRLQAIMAVSVGEFIGEIIGNNLDLGDGLVRAQKSPAPPDEKRHRMVTMTSHNHQLCRLCLGLDLGKVQVGSAYQDAG